MVVQLHLSQMCTEIMNVFVLQAVLLSVTNHYMDERVTDLGLRSVGDEAKYLL